MSEERSFGKYRIIERLAQGGMGVVYKAYDESLDREVALKTILPEFVASDEVKQRLVREAQAAAKLQHPNVVTVFDFGETADGRMYIAMEYVRGRSLAAVIHERLPLERRLELMADICKALAYAHKKGIVHRDVKPSNVLVDEDGTVKLLDFGIAHLAGSSLTRTGVAMGTPEYMSPEMVEGGELDARSDIFSCGVMLFEMLTRSNPFRQERITATMYQVVHGDPPPLRELRPRLPRQLDSIIRRMLAKDPADRYQEMEEVIGDLEHLVSRGLLSKAIQAKKLDDLMEEVEAKVAEAEKDPQVKEILRKELHEPLSRRRRQVRRISKASDTSITLEEIEREIDSLKSFHQRLGDFLRKELPKKLRERASQALASRSAKDEEATVFYASDRQGPSPPTPPRPESERPDTEPTLMVAPKGRSRYWILAAALSVALLAALAWALIDRASGPAGGAAEVAGEEAAVAEGDADAAGPEKSGKAAEARREAPEEPPRPDRAPAPPPDSYRFQAEWARKECEGVLELREKLLRFISQECTGASLSVSTLESVELDGRELKAVRNQGRDFVFRVSGEPGAMARALRRFGWSSSDGRSFQPPSKQDP